MDNRTLILLLVFGFSLMMLWDAWHRQNEKLQPSPVTTSSTVHTVSEEQDDKTIPSPTQINDVPAVVAPPVDSVQATAGVEPVRVETDLYIAEISPVGGDLVRMELKKYRKPDDKDKPMVLFDTMHRYVAQTGLIGNGLPNHKTSFTIVPGPLSLAENDEKIELRLEASGDDGIAVAKTYTFYRDSYLIDVDYGIVNSGQKTVAPYVYFQLQRDDKLPEGESRMISTFTGPVVYTAQDKYQKVAFSDIEKKKAKFTEVSQDGWLAMVQHYFVSAWVLDDSQKREFYMRNISPGVFSAGMIVALDQLAPGDNKSLKASLYAGPQEQSRLKKIAEGLTLVVDYGWLTVIAAPLFWVLELVYKWVGNWGWAIIGLTFLIKLLFYPLSAASYKSMAKMRTVTPRMTQLKELYGDDKARFQQEMMDLYRKEKINPLGGCLPIVVQIPVFIALYWVLLGVVEMRDAPWILWIHDLTSPDPYFILPIIMMLSMFVQFKLNPTPPDPIQAKVMMIMPIVFGIMFFIFPAGLVLYWVVNNILSIIQQWQITRMIEGSAKKKAAA